MKVREFIKMLKKYSPDSKIAFHCTIESGMSTVVCEGADIILDIDQENDEVFLEVFGEETSWS